MTFDVVLEQTTQNRDQMLSSSQLIKNDCSERLHYLNIDEWVSIKGCGIISNHISGL
jgi:hypothetical protein